MRRFLERFSGVLFFASGRLSANPWAVIRLDFNPPPLIR